MMIFSLYFSLLLALCIFSLESHALRSNLRLFSTGWLCFRNETQTQTQTNKQTNDVAANLSARLGQMRFTDPKLLQMNKA